MKALILKSTAYAVYMYVCIYVCIYVYMCVCVCVCVCVRVCMYMYMYMYPLYYTANILLYLLRLILSVLYHRSSRTSRPSRTTLTRWCPRANEGYHCVKRHLLQCQKRPVTG